MIEKKILQFIFIFCIYVTYVALKKCQAMYNTFHKKYSIYENNV